MTLLPLLYANTGSVIVSHQDCVLKLAVAVGDDKQSVAMIALSLQCAVGLHAALGAAMQALVGEQGPGAFQENAQGVSPSLESWRDILAHRRAVLHERLGWLLEQREMGVTLMTLAAQLGVGEPTLWRFLRQHAPEAAGYQQPRQTCEAQASAIYAARQAGRSTRAIASELGLSPSAVQKWVRTHPLPAQQEDTHGLG